MTYIFWLIALFCISLIYYLKITEQWCIKPISDLWVAYFGGLYESSVDNNSGYFLRMFIRMDRSLYDEYGTRDSI